MKKYFQLIYIVLSVYLLLYTFLFSYFRIRLFSSLAPVAIYLLGLITLIIFGIVFVGWIRRKPFFTPSLLTKIFYANTLGFFIIFLYILNITGFILGSIFPICNTGGMPGGTYQKCDCWGITLRAESNIDYVSNVCVGYVSNTTMIPPSI